jgi:F-type H+-transporting ATPase subunit epsilon
MAELLKFELVSPERLVMSADVQQVTVPGTEGEFTVLARHAPVLSTVRPGVITVVQDGGAEMRIFVRGGFAEVNPDGLTVLAEQAIPMAELDRDALAAEIRNAEEDLADAKTDEARNRAQQSLDHMRQLADAL